MSQKTNSHGLDQHTHEIGNGQKTKLTSWGEKTKCWWIIFQVKQGLTNKPVVRGHSDKWSAIPRCQLYRGEIWGVYCILFLAETKLVSVLINSVLICFRS